MTIKKCKTSNCMFCSINPSVDSKSDYWLEDIVKIKGIGLGDVFGGICKRHYEQIGKHYLKSQTKKARK